MISKNMKERTTSPAGFVHFVVLIKHELHHPTQGNTSRTFSNRTTSSSSLCGGRYSLETRFFIRFFKGVPGSLRGAFRFFSDGRMVVLRDNRSACTLSLYNSLLLQASSHLTRSDKRCLQCRKYFFTREDWRENLTAVASMRAVSTLSESCFCPGGRSSHASIFDAADIVLSGGWKASRSKLGAVEGKTLEAEGDGITRGLRISVGAEDKDV